MKTLYTILLLLLAQMAISQNFTSFLNYMDAQNDSATKVVKLDSFMTEFGMSGFPYITEDTANFIYRGAGTSAGVAGDFNGWDPGFSPMTNMLQTDFWYYSVTFESNARMDYKLVLNGGNWILDPLNPNTVSGGFGPNSELAMPDYVQPWEIEEFAHTQKGTLETFSLASTNTGSSYQIQVYLPAGYDPNGSVVYPTAYFQDGQEYVSLADAKNIFDNLIDSNLMSAAIGVFVRPTDRNNEYAGSKRVTYRQFFIDELVPFIDANYRSFASPSRRAVIGASFGGNISALISYNHPDVFGNCGLHSGAFWPNANETYDLIVNGNMENIKYASIWGTYEGSLTTNMQNFKDAILGDGYELWWNELPEGHSWGLWRATTDDILKYLFPPGLTSVEEVLQDGNAAISVYPNPAAQSIQVSFENPKQQSVEIEIHDADGRMVHHSKTFADQSTIDLSGNAAGNYFLTIISDGVKYNTTFVVSSGK